MQFEIKRKGDYLPYLNELLISQYGFKKFQADNSTNALIYFLRNLLTDVYIGIESPYVDKLYRDTFYYYYSSKFSEYKKDCIRLSFFNTAIQIEDFYSKEGAKKLQNAFLGFLVIRPIPEKIIGRNVFNPIALPNGKVFSSMWVNVAVAINGIKLNVDGFPHASQDLEMTVCAETTLWSVMEYFSHKYVEYKPVLPTNIYNVLTSISTQRQIPSTGLSAFQISYVLKEFGFGVKTYSREDPVGIKFNRTIQMYVESGIPVLAIIQNNKGIAHIMSLIGRSEFDTKNGFIFSPIANFVGGAPIYDFYEPPCEYLAVDDNLSPFEMVGLNNPSSNYDLFAPHFSGCQILMAIVPLHRKVYMEADTARESAIQYLKEINASIMLPALVLRVFLSSGRSYKNYASLDSDLKLEVKMLISNINMPKFIWIAELTTLELVNEKKACGVIIMDATEPIKYGILACLLENTYIGAINNNFGRYSIPLEPFNRFNNLKNF